MKDRGSVRGRRNINEVKKKKIETERR